MMLFRSGSDVQRSVRMLLRATMLTYGYDADTSNIRLIQMV